jgi:hypothetical protein
MAAEDMCGVDTGIVSVDIVGWNEPNPEGRP